MTGQRISESINPPLHPIHSAPPLPQARPVEALHRIGQSPRLGPIELSVTNPAGGESASHAPQLWNAGIYTQS